MAKKASRYHKRVKKKENKKEENKLRRDQYRKRQRNKRILNYSIAALIGVALVFGIYSLVSGGSVEGEYDEFARCLTESGAIMYGTDWCKFCQAQKRDFGKSFRLVNYINCDLNPAACDLAGVEGYPTWTFANGPSASGVQELSELAGRTGCTLE